MFSGILRRLLKIWFEFAKRDNLDADKVSFKARTEIILVCYFLEAFNDKAYLFEVLNTLQNTVKKILVIFGKMILI